MDRSRWVVVGVLSLGVAILIALRLIGHTAAYEPPLPDRPDDLSVDVHELITERVQSLRSDPTQAENWFNLAIAYEANEMRELSRDTYLLGLNIDDRHPQPWYHLGLVHAELAEDEAAFNAFHNAHERAPQYASAHWRMGLALLNLGKPNEAEQHFRDVIRSSEHEWQARLGLARALIEQGQNQSAAAILENLLHWPGLDAAYINLLLSAAYRGLGRLEDADIAGRLGRGSGAYWSCEWQQTRDEHRRGVAGVSEVARRLGDRGHHPQALAKLENLLTHYSDDPLVWHNLGIAHVQAGSIDTAIAVLQEGLDRFPTHGALHAALGDVYLNVLDHIDPQQFDALWRTAMRHANAALLANPNHADAHRIRGDLRLRNNQPKRALQAYIYAVEQRPGDPTLHFQIATLHASLGHHAKAIEACDRVVRLDPLHDEVAFTAAAAALKIDDHDTAGHWIELAASLNPDDPRLHDMKTQASRPHSP